MKWPFNDPPNVAVFTTKQIVAGKDWIQYVSHDEDDGAWQFQPAGGSEVKEASIVGLEEMTKIDPTIIPLADLPIGWCASRTGPNGEWLRKKKQRVFT
jgi:hypothetical protein